MSTLAEYADAGYVIEDWQRWQQGDCGGYAAAMIQAYPHLRLGGIDFDNDPGYDNPSHYVAHDDDFAYDSAGRHSLPYNGLDSEMGGRWLSDMGEPDDFGLSERHGECGDYDDNERAAVIAHAERHGILPRT